MRRIDKGEHALGPGQSNELLPWQAAARHGANTVKKQKLDSVVAVLFARGVNGRLVKLYHLVFVAQRVVQRHALVHNTLLLGKEIKRFEASTVGGGRTNDNVAGLKAPRPQNSVDTMVALVTNTRLSAEGAFTRPATSSRAGSILADSSWSRYLSGLAR